MTDPLTPSTPSTPTSAPASDPQMAQTPEAALLAELGNKTPDELEAERRRIVGAAGGNYRLISDEDLARLAFITGTLRRRTSGPPKEAKVKTPGTKGKNKVSLDDALEMF